MVNKEKFEYFTKKEILNFTSEIEKTCCLINHLEPCIELLESRTSDDFDNKTPIHIVLGAYRDLKRITSIIETMFLQLNNQYYHLDKVNTYLEHLHGLTHKKVSNSFTGQETDAIIDRIIAIETNAEWTESLT